MKEVNRQDLPPKQPDILWVERLKGGERQKFVCYSPSLWGVWTHWTGRETKPCYANHDLCEGGHSDETMRWRAYIHAWSYVRGRPVFVQLTGAAAGEWLEQCAPGVELRGQIIEVYRTKADKGRLHVAVNQWQKTGVDKMPPAMDPLKSLFHLWKVKPLVELLESSLVTFPEDIPEERQTA